MQDLGEAINSDSARRQGSDKLTMAALSKFKNPKNFDADFHISLKNKYVYVMVCKAASSTVTYHLQHVEFLGSRFSVRNVNDRRQSPHIAPYQLTEARFLSILRNDAFRKVTVVRNPYARLLSCYLHRVIGERKMNPTKLALRTLFRRTDPASLSFAAFVDAICDQEPRRMERHYALQRDMVMYPLIRYDFIGKVETLHADLLQMEQLLFGKKVFDRKALKRENRAPMQTGASAKLREHYTDAIAQKVAERYLPDFEAFGYSLDPDASQ